MHASDWLGNRQRLETCEHMLDERAPVRLPYAGRPVDAVEQLADRDDADRTRLVADKLLEHGRLVSLPLDEDVGVDQDAQASSGGPTERRIVRTSSAKSSSMGGADRTSSRNRSADTTRAFGGPMTATGAPARVTSISSPAATRFKISEKRRATSVALRRTIASMYQINLIAPADVLLTPRRSVDRKPESA
jgi:hypothetical protein